MREPSARSLGGHATANRTFERAVPSIWTTSSPGGWGHHQTPMSVAALTIRWMATRIVPKTQLRDQLRTELRHLFDHNIVITDRGRPIAVIVHIDRWNDLQEQLETLDYALELYDLDRRAEAAEVAPRLRTRTLGPLYR